MLFVRATDQDLDTIERAMEMLNMRPPQVHIKARFVEVTKDKSGTPNYGGYLGWTNPLDVFPGVTASRTRSSQNLDPTNATVTAVLTDTDSRVAFHYLTLRPGFEQLAEPEVVTISGRQTQMRATQILTNVVRLQETRVTNHGNVTVSNSIVPQTTPIEIGPVLDVVPYVLSDGDTINLTLIPSLTEILVSSNSVPNYRVRQAVTVVNLWDNQTAVIGSLPEKDYVNGEEVTDKSKSSDKELLIFITATIVDAAGNRVHADDELPFAQKGVPPQPSQPKPKPK